MEEEEQELWTYLTTANPELTKGQYARQSLSRSKNWSKPCQIQEWEDFQMEALQEMYEGALKEVLGTTCKLREFSDIPRYPFREIYDEASLERLLAKWTQSVVTEALEAAQNINPLDQSEKIYMASGGQAQWSPRKKAETRQGMKYLDWAAVKRKECAVNDPKTAKELAPKPQNLLPGETKISSKWRSSNVRRGWMTKESNWKTDILPILQIFNYCLAARARYGYVITDHELVVVRIRPGPQRLINQSREEMTPRHGLPSQSNGVSHIDSDLSDAEMEECSSNKNTNDNDEQNSPVRDAEKLNQPQLTEEISSLPPSQVELKLENESVQTDGDGIKSIPDAEPGIIRRTRSSGCVEIKSIPWSHMGKTELTVNLALWWLHVIAAHENEISYEYIPLRSEKHRKNSQALASSFTEGVSSMKIDSRHHLTQAPGGIVSAGDLSETLQKGQKRQKSSAAHHAVKRRKTPKS